MTPKPRILVIDDDIDYLESISAILEANGYDVIAADSAKNGLKNLESEIPQLIIIDLMMNTVNEGYDFCLQIGHDKRFEDVPLLMISAAHQDAMFKDVNFAPDVFWFPIDDFLDKPITRESLLNHVSKLLKNRM